MGTFFGPQNGPQKSTENNTRPNPQHTRGGPHLFLGVGSCGNKLIMAQASAASSGNQQLLPCTLTAKTTTTAATITTAARLWRTIVMAALLALFLVLDMAL